MSKDLQKELERIFGDGNDRSVKKVNATFYLSSDVLDALREICVDKRKMSRTVEALIRDFVRQRTASVVEMPSHAPKKLG